MEQRLAESRKMGEIEKVEVTEVGEAGEEEGSSRIGIGGTVLARVCDLMVLTFQKREDEVK